MYVRTDYIFFYLHKKYLHIYNIYKYSISTFRWICSSSSLLQSAPLILGAGRLADGSASAQPRSWFGGPWWVAGPSSGRGGRSPALLLRCWGKVRPVQSSDLVSGLCKGTWPEKQKLFNLLISITCVNF